MLLLLLLLLLLLIIAAALMMAAAVVPVKDYLWLLVLVVVLVVVLVLVLVRMGCYWTVRYDLFRHPQRYPSTVFAVVVAAFFGSSSGVDCVDPAYCCGVALVTVRPSLPFPILLLRCGFG